MSQESKVIFFCQDFSSSFEKHWCRAFYEYAHTNTEYDFSTSFSHLNSDARIIFFSCDNKIIDWLARNNRRADFILLPDEESSNTKILSYADKILDLRTEKIFPSLGQSSTVEESSKPTTRIQEQNDLYLLSPKSYLVIWECFITLRYLPRSITVYQGLNEITPRWFVRSLEKWGVIVIRKQLDYNTLAEMGSKSTHMYRDDMSIDFLDIVAQSKGVFPSRLVANGAIHACHNLQDHVVMSVQDVISKLDEKIIKTQKTLPKARAPISGPINVVCSNPTYLFADLVKRFEDAGCIHSELPLKEARCYIWMRPQEYVVFTDFIKKRKSIDIQKYYKNLLAKNISNVEQLSLKRIADTSLVIHHGTCYPPIVQFDAASVALRLTEIKNVVGVCEFNECYGPSAHLASKKNFTFVPIGYDDNLFTESLVSKSSNKCFNIGFVGRAYGTNDKNKLNRNVLAHPKGYRKGGDIFLDIICKLHSRRIPLHVHILGQNWDELSNELHQAGIPSTYYVRDKNVSYKHFPEIFAALDALCISARAEGGPVSAIEAMSVGVPIIGTNVGLVPYLSTRSEFCKVYDYDTKWHQAKTIQAADLLSQLYKNRPTYQQKLNIRKSVENFTTNNWVNTIISLVDQ